MNTDELIRVLRTSGQSEAQAIADVVEELTDADGGAPSKELISAMADEFIEWGQTIKAQYA